MRLIPILAAGLAASAAQAETREFQVRSFQSLESAGSADVIITTGGALSVRGEGDTAVLDALELRSDGERLVVDRRPGVRWPRQGRATLYVTMPRLVAANASGSGSVRVDRVSGPSFAGTVDGSGDLAIDDLRVTAAVLVSSGSGNVKASGDVEVLTADASGSGDVAVASLRARAATITATGSGNVAAWAFEEANVRSSGSGHAVVGGGGRCRLRATGSGEARCG